MPPPSKDFEITNYDVLADEISNPISSSESKIGLSLAAHSYHVGNNRLEVLCNIHNQAFSDHQAKGDEAKCTSVVEKIINIVQNQCVPKGRFLERNSKGEWKEVDPEKAKLLVRQALTKGQNQSSSSGGDTEQSAQESKKKQEDDAEKKRRRRSSLLRRSVSSSMLPNLVASELDAKQFDDKKKSTRRGTLTPSDDSPDSSRTGSPVPDPEKEAPRPVFGRSQSVDMGIGNKTRRARRLAVTAAFDSNPLLVKETKKMDVLLNTGKDALLPGTDLHGNNRLRVMVQIQTASYQKANEEEKEKMAKTLVETIENFWGGRILSKVPSMMKGREKYLKLDKDHALGAIKFLLSGKPAEQEEQATIGDGPDMEIKQGRRASLKAIQSIASAGTAGNSASILPSTLPTLPADMQHLRSAAVKSLQKRKQRQGLNSRIRGLTADKAAVFQDGSSNASVMSSSVAPGNSSPIPTKLSPVPSTNIISNLPHGMPHIPHFRQPSSGASVASTSTQMSTAHSYQPPPGSFRREQSLGNASVGNMSTGSANTSMSMNTMNAARTMANINLGGRPNNNMNMQHSNMMMQQNGMHGPMLGSELQIPANILAAQQQQQLQMAAQHQQMNAQFQRRNAASMPSVPEDAHNFPGNYGPPSMTANQLAQLNQGFPPDFASGQYEGGVSGGQAPMERNSLLNSTGSDGLPIFAKGEMDLLIKGLEMAENQQQQQQNSNQGGF